MDKEAPVLNGLNLVVQDMEAALVFYRLLGVDIPDQSVWRTTSGAHHVEISMPDGIDLDLDSTSLARHYNAGWDSSPSSCLVGFSLPTREAVDARYAELTDAGYKGLQLPYDAFWGARYAIIEDPDGNHVGLMSPVDPSRRAAPPAV